MILHISTNQGGGAGIAARRLHKGLLRKSIDSRFISAFGTTDKKQGEEVLPRRYPRFWRRAAWKMGFCLNAQQRWARQMKSLNSTDLFTSGIEADDRLLDQTMLKKADLINLHWVAGILPWQKFFRQVQCPIIWTLHDMNPFLGIFHYECDLKEASASARNLDLSVRNQKRSLLEKKLPLVIVSPSKWLLEKSQRSETFCHYHHEHIPNGVDTSIFKVYDQGVARSVFNLPLNKKLLLVVAERLDDHRKGFDLFIESLDLIRFPGKWDLVAVGNGDLPVKNIEHHCIHTINDERLMALLYAASDLTVIPSREDNSPNVILESLCCGTPVVGNPAGGIPESIVPGIDGFIGEGIDALALSVALEKGMSHTFNRNAIANRAARRFDFVVQAEKYIQIYRRT